jgi:nitroreductase
MKTLYRTVIAFLKRMRRRSFQLLLHVLDANYDLFRYLRYSNSLCWSTSERQRLEALLFFYYHKIEKALALPEVKPLFGLGYIETTLDLMDRWLAMTADTQAPVFCGAYAALACYREHTAQALAQRRPDLVQRIDKLLADHKDMPADRARGGALAIQAEDMRPACPPADFERFVFQRHSVRNFAKRPVPDANIEYAIKLAQRSPSVCNRQCWRVHVFTSSADKALVLQHQNGNEGFGHLADRILLITADLRSFLSSGERNQAYVDAGMFAMTLLYALQAQGIASCCLNLCTSFTEDVALRRVCRIPAWETAVMMIAIGYPPDSLSVAASARNSTDAVLAFRDLRAEEKRG